MSILINNVSKSFGNFRALDDVSFEAPTGALVALLGPSGSGKTTLLRIIAGLEVADRGTVLQEQEDITSFSARDRKIGFVFQHYALFRHMTVAQNIGYGLKVRKTPKEKIRERVDELIKLIRLDGMQGRYPSQLSGGQRQRVALARALAAEPKVLLLDEPFGALDANVRQELRKWLRHLHDEIQVTSIFVTHDQEEAFELADRVVVMNQARVEQIGTPDEIYDNPATPFVYSFLGNVNLFHGRIRHGRLGLGNTEVFVPEHATTPDAPAVAYVRPHEVKVRVRANAAASIPATIQRVNSAGPTVQLELTRVDDSTPLTAELSKEESSELNLTIGATVYVELTKVRVFAGDGSPPEDGNGPASTGSGGTPPAAAVSG
ncbi:sulfate/molybdate ABC transporter ATP-binding protein [Rhizobium mesoamericanum]|uniref:sulfate/molybdate ABC transporter ATP-binding protein n=1 Tax=Rhizobium mesoamericanum TaxID=1079800 RepID=UPI0004272DC4|nr:sulfate/molybdate ABC transporter ATP-binding protein [Rhizobium mesoamericanum]